jgi:hypothetical protein
VWGVGLSDRTSLDPVCVLIAVFMLEGSDYSTLHVTWTVRRACPHSA